MQVSSAKFSENFARKTVQRYWVGFTVSLGFCCEAANAIMRAERAKANLTEMIFPTLLGNIISLSSRPFSFSFPFFPLSSSSLLLLFSSEYDFLDLKVL